MGELIEFPRSRVFREVPITKTELANKLGRSRRWIEIQQRDHGLPVNRSRNGYCVYRLSEVLAWLRASDPNHR